MTAHSAGWAVLVFVSAVTEEFEHPEVAVFKIWVQSHKDCWQEMSLELARTRAGRTSNGT